MGVERSAVRKRVRRGPLPLFSALCCGPVLSGRVSFCYDANGQYDKDEPWCYFDMDMCCLKFAGLGAKCDFPCGPITEEGSICKIGCICTSCTILDHCGLYYGGQAHLCGIVKARLNCPYDGYYGPGMYKSAEVFPDGATPLPPGECACCCIQCLPAFKMCAPPQPPAGGSPPEASNAPAGGPSCGATMVR